ncbi:MAG: DUF4350 domain-containing protein [Thermoplasmatota archaeon]
MRKKMRTITIYIIAASLVVLMFLFSLSAPLVTTGADFSIYNTGWNGCSRLAVRTYETGEFTPNLKLANDREIEVTQRSILEYSVVPNSTSMMFLGPNLDFTQGDIDHIHDFLMDGGKIVLADDYGNGNQLLGGLNTSSRFAEETLYDLSFEKNPEFSVVYDFRDHALTQNLSFVMLNRPTYLRLGSEAVPLMNTSEGSWVERDDGDHRIGKSPVMSLEPYGDGELILLSDPSMMINSMLDRLDNEIVMMNLLDYISEDRSDIILDESHREMNIVFRLAYTGDYPSRSVSFMVITGGIFITGAVLIPGVKGKMFKMIHKSISFFIKEEKEDTLSKVLNNHPEWDKRKMKWIHERLSESVGKRED